MSSLLTLHRHPILGFNSSILLELADKQTTEHSSFVSESDVDERMHTENALKLAGCVPLISIAVGAFRLYRAYQVSQMHFTGEQRIDRDWMVKKEVALAIAEIFQATIVLLGLHLVATVFDHAVVLLHYCSPESHASIYEDGLAVTIPNTARIEKNREACAANLQIAQQAVGGEAAFRLLPVLNLGNRKSLLDRFHPPGNIDFIDLDELTAPVMRGADVYGRPFITLKLCTDITENVYEDDEEKFQRRQVKKEIKFAVTFFQKYETNSDPTAYRWGTDGQWYTYPSFWKEEIISIFPPGALTDAVWESVHQIVVEKNHPTLRLAT